MNERERTEANPAMEVHLSETFITGPPEQEARYVIIWINGKRFEGTIYENTKRDLELQKSNE
jgi:hypothetical protein